MELKLTNINYRIKDGNTEAINVSFQAFDNQENLTATVSLTDGELDNMTRNEIIEAGRERLKLIVNGEEAE